jgi:hypothetical protein
VTETLTKEVFLLAEIERHIDWFEKESTKHKRLHRTYRVSAFVLTAAATVLAGLPMISSPQHVVLNVLLLLVTCTLTVVNSLEGLRKPAELWIHERTTLYQLHDLRRDLRFHLSSPTGGSTFEEIYAQLQDTLQSSRDQWGRLVNKPRDRRADGSE